MQLKADVIRGRAGDEEEEVSEDAEAIEKAVDEAAPSMPPAWIDVTDAVRFMVSDSTLQFHKASTSLGQTRVSAGTNAHYIHALRVCHLSCSAHQVQSCAIKFYMYSSALYVSLGATALWY